MTPKMASGKISGASGIVRTFMAGGLFAMMVLAVVFQIWNLAYRKAGVPVYVGNGSYISGYVTEYVWNGVTLYSFDFWNYIKNVAASVANLTIWDSTGNVFSASYVDFVWCGDLFRYIGRCFCSLINLLMAPVNFLFIPVKLVANILRLLDVTMGGFLATLGNVFGLDFWAWVDSIRFSVPLP